MYTQQINAILYLRMKKKKKKLATKRKVDLFKQRFRFKKKPSKQKVHREITNRKKEKRFVDSRLVALVVIFSISGILMIFSASAAQAGDNPDFGYDSFFLVKRQIIWVLLGSFLAIFLYYIPLPSFRNLSAPMLAVGIILLIVLVPEAVFKIDMPLVKTLNGATRWIDLGAFDLQPAEFIKFAFVVYLSAWLTRKNDGSKSKISSDQIMNVVLPFIILLGSISLLVLAQKDLDTTAIIVLTVLTVYYIAGTDRVHTYTVFGILLFSLIFGSFAITQEDYRRGRVTSFWEILINGEPSTSSKLDESFQNWNGIVAIANGGLFGRGFTESRYKLGFLQEAAYTDSIFAVIGEEFGFVGAMLIILGFLFFASVGYEIAQKAPNKFASLLATGMTSWIIIQAFLNIAANLAVIPFGGMPLPFFSYGGSSTIAIFMAVGVIANVSKYAKDAK